MLLNTYMKDKNEDKMPNTSTAIKIDTELKAPSMFKLIYINDNTTSMRFVIDSLMVHFAYADTTAEKIADTIHTSGAAVAAVLPFELAEQKGIEITTQARQEGFPLQIKIEKDKS